MGLGSEERAFRTDGEVPQLPLSVCFADTMVASCRLMLASQDTTYLNLGCFGAQGLSSNLEYTSMMRPFAPLRILCVLATRTLLNELLRCCRCRDIAQLPSGLLSLAFLVVALTELRNCCHVADHD